MASKKTADYDAIVIGAGFGGIRSLWELDKLGLTVKCFEAGSDVGGAWYWNRYPGARTDSEAWIYSMNFAPEVQDEWGYNERYPSQKEVQQYLTRVVGKLFPPTGRQSFSELEATGFRMLTFRNTDRFDLRQHIQFSTRVAAAHFSDGDNLWTITSTSGSSSTCRYFIPASGPLSIAKELPFAGLKSYTGEWYQTSVWPKDNVDFRGKRIAIVGTGATGVQIIPKIASVAKQLTVFQRTPNYVLPGRNYVIDEHQAADIKDRHDAIWNGARKHVSGLAMVSSGRNAKDVTEADKIRQVLDAGWEDGGFHFFYETFDDMFTSKETNDLASEYLRQKIRAIVQDQEKAELLCPKYPFLSKRPPCGHFYYETYNRPNVKLVDISADKIDVYEKGFRTSSGAEHEFDMIIFALGFDAGTGALSEIDVKGRQDRSLREFWAKRVETFAGVLVPGFPNMFLICGPHVPFGNMPVVVDIQVNWIGKTIRHMEENRLDRIEVTEGAADAWTLHLAEVFRSTLFAESSKESGAWFVGANIPGKTNSVLFYFGGVPTWSTWLENESRSAWESMNFAPLAVANAVREDSAQPNGRVRIDVTLAA